MSRGDSFGGFSGKTFSDFVEDFSVQPIKPEFGGSVPDSLYSSNRNSAWSRWRRGFELATAAYAQDAFEFPFRYTIPVIGASEGGVLPEIAGTFKGFPTPNRELGMQWAATVLGGSLRFDNLEDDGQLLSIDSVREDDEYWYVKLAGTYDEDNPLPPPLFVPVPDDLPLALDLEPAKPFRGYVLEDRILTPQGVPITQNTRNPQTNTLYGYVGAVLEDVLPFTGELQLRKQGSLEATEQGVLVTPATRPPHVGRFFMNGARFACSCQDFTQRDYAYLSSLGLRKGYQFPRSSCATLKPGRYEEVRLAGELLDAAMTEANVNRQTTVVSPDDEFLTIYALNKVADGGAGLSGRDFPGVFRDFGAQYLNSVGNNPDAKTIGMPKFKDYTSTINPEGRNTITQLTDTWTFLLDEYRSCKHIYAMRYAADLFPPEPSDYPVEVGSMAEWEEQLVMKVQKDQEKAALKYLTNGLAYMDVPPRNVQSPPVVDMVSKLFNLPTYFIRIGNFTMFDKNGTPYVPGQGEGPATT